MEIGTANFSFGDKAHRKGRCVILVVWTERKKQRNSIENFVGEFLPHSLFWGMKLLLKFLLSKDRTTNFFVGWNTAMQLSLLWQHQFFSNFSLVVGCFPVFFHTLMLPAPDVSTAWYFLRLVCIKDLRQNKKVLDKSAGICRPAALRASTALGWLLFLRSCKKTYINYWTNRSLNVSILSSCLVSMIK